MVATGKPGSDADHQDEGAFTRQFDEPIERVLDLSTWSTGTDLDRLYARLDQEVRAALAQDADHRAVIREKVFPRLKVAAALAAEADVYRATPEEIRQVHRGLLFNGQVEAADGTVAMHDTLPLTVAQIGVALVSYHGDSGTWVQRLFRRDVRAHVPGGPEEEAIALLDKRRLRGGFGQEDHDPLSSLARRGLMAYAERAALLHKSTARWRMGHGAPVAVEMLTDEATDVFLETGLAVMRDLLLEHRRFVFVPSASTDRLLYTLGVALEPLEYLVFDTLEERLVDALELRGRNGQLRYSASTPKILEFIRSVGPKLVRGVYRASHLAPGQIFYAHADHVHEAALIAMADSMLHEHRGFPLLIDLADMVCSAHFSAASFAAGVEASYAAAGAPYRYLNERGTRKG